MKILAFFQEDVKSLLLLSLTENKDRLPKAVAFLSFDLPKPGSRGTEPVKPKAVAGEVTSNPEDCGIRIFNLQSQIHNPKSEMMQPLRGL